MARPAEVFVRTLADCVLERIEDIVAMHENESRQVTTRHSNNGCALLWLMWE